MDDRRTRPEDSRDDKGPDDDVAFQEWGEEHGFADKDGIDGFIADWRLAESLKRFKEQLNAAFPGRSTASDGGIGDERHCAGGGKSDHCPNIRDGAKGVVTAFDATHDPAGGCDIHKVVEAIRGSKDNRVKYIIWNRRICASKPMGGAAAWAWRAYSGDNPHDKHAHVSVLPDKARYDDRKDWTIT